MPRGGARPGAGRPKIRMPSRISKEASDHSLPPQKCKTGPKPGSLANGWARVKKTKQRKELKLGRAVLEQRIRELLKRNDEPAKAEAARLAIALLPYEQPRLQAIAAQTVLETGDTLSALLRRIDGIAARGQT